MAKKVKQAKTGKKVGKQAARPQPKKTTVRSVAKTKGQSKRPAVKPSAGKAKAKPTPAAPVKTGVTKPAPVKSIFGVKDTEVFRKNLVSLREKITGHITSLADDTLKYVDDTPSDDRTDDFDREFALNIVSSEHDALFEIDDALRRLDRGSYGKCDGCGCAIERPRLMALPFARNCVKCQSEMEKGRTRFRPFGETLDQAAEAVPDVADAEEAE